MWSVWPIGMRAFLSTRLPKDLKNIRWFFTRQMVNCMESWSNRGDTLCTQAMEVEPTLKIAFEKKVRYKSGAMMKYMLDCWLQWRCQLRTTNFPGLCVLETYISRSEVFHVWKNLTSLFFCICRVTHSCNSQTKENWIFIIQLLCNYTHFVSLRAAL